MTVRQAVILVGGLGTRLRSLGLGRPKPLVEIAGRPFVEHVIMSIARYGITDVLLLAGFMGDLVHDTYHGRTLFGVRIEVVIEPEPAGTAGALAFALNKLDDIVAVANGDSLFWSDYSAMLARPLGAGVNGRLLLREIGDASRYGTVETDASGKVIAFNEKVAGATNKRINAGLYVLRREALRASITQLPCSLEVDVFPDWCAQGQLEAIAGTGYFIDIGLPETYHQASRELDAVITRPAVFLDRDGVINHDAGYTYRPEDLVFTPDAIEGIRFINERGYYTIVVSNQAGVARGLYTSDDVERFHREMQRQLMHQGAHVDAFYYAPYHPDGTVPVFAMDHHDRKPNPGMLQRAFSEWPIGAAGSFLIGDKDSDVDAAAAAGIPGYRIASNTGSLLQAVKFGMSPS